MLSKWLTFLKIIQWVLVILAFISSLLCWIDFQIIKYTYNIVLPYIDFVRCSIWLESRISENYTYANAEIMLHITWFLAFVFFLITVISSLGILFNKILINDKSISSLNTLISNEVYFKLFFDVGYEKYSKERIEKSRNDTIHVYEVIYFSLKKDKNMQISLLTMMILSLSMLLPLGKGTFTSSNSLLFYFGNPVIAFTAAVMLILIIMTILSCFLTALDYLLRR